MSECKWTPVTEKLPDTNSIGVCDPVLVTCVYGGISKYVTTAVLQKIIVNNHTSMTWRKSRTGYVLYDEVTAWMPLPEAY